MFKGICIQKDETGYHAKLTDLDETQLPEGDVTIQVAYSSLNYKDGLAITGKGAVVRQFPMVPGIDLAGTVVESSSPQYKVGDEVVLNGWGVGEKHWGGLAQKARLKSEWLIPLPKGLSTKQAMAIGTAGYTAMLCVMALEKQGVTPQQGKVLVTGANGGVGSFAVVILSRLGYEVIASTGRPEEFDYLIRLLGAKEVINRNELSNEDKPLLAQRWFAAIDCAGSYTLANVCASTAYGGTVVACGLAQGMDFNSSVAPFILRGITLVGIDCVMRPYADRMLAWKRLAQIMTPALLDAISTEIKLEDAVAVAAKLMQGKVRGRVVVSLK